MFPRKALPAMCLSSCLLLGLFCDKAPAADYEVFLAKGLCEIKVNKLGKFKIVGQGILYHEASGLFEFISTDNEYSPVIFYLGKYKKQKKGKQMQFTLDSFGKSLLKECLASLIWEKCKDQDEQMEIKSITLKKIKISKTSVKNGMPKDFKAKIMGEVTLKHKGKSIKANFIFNSKHKFIKKLE